MSLRELPLHEYYVLFALTWEKETSCIQAISDSSATAKPFRCGTIALLDLLSRLSGRIDRRPIVSRRKPQILPPW